MDDLAQVGTRTRFVNLSGMGIGDDGAARVAAALQRAPKLQELRLDDNLIGDAGFCAVAGALHYTRKLQTLVLGNNPASDVGVGTIAAALQHTPDLQLLYLHNTSTRDAGASAVAAALQHTRNLRKLWFSHAEIGSAGAGAIAAALQHTRNLELLSVHNNLIGSAGASAIADALQDTPNLRELSLTSNRIGLAGANAIADALWHTPNLQALYVSNNNIGDAGATAVAVALQNTPNLQTFHLSSNNIGDAGAGAVAAALQHTPSLQKLWLSRNQVGDAGASFISDALQHMPNLQAVHLHNNSIGDAGAIAISTSLQHTQNLQMLTLSNNEIGDTGASAVAAALLHTPKLHKLWLHHNQIGDAGTDSIVTALQHTPNLQKLKLDGNPIGEEGAALLAAAMVLMPECEFGSPQPHADDNLPSPEEARIRLTAARVRCAWFKLTLAKLSARLAATTSPTGALHVFAEHMAPLLQHIPSVSTALRDADVSFDAARAASPDAAHDPSCTAELDTLTEAALAKASRGQLSHEDKARLQAARQRQLDALAHLQHAGTLTAAADSASKRLETLQSQVSGSLRVAANPTDAPAAPDELDALTDIAASAATRMEELQAAAQPHVAALTQMMDEMDAIRSNLATQVANTLRLPDDADLAAAAPSALVGTVAARLRDGTQLLAKLNSQEAVDRHQQQLHLREKTTLDMSDAASLPGLEERLTDLRSTMHDKDDDLAAKMLKLRQGVKRNRLTPSERAKSKARVAELQKDVAALRAELESWEKQVEHTAEQGLPEAVQLLTTLRNQHDVPEVLRMLQPTGLYRNRSLTTDYTPVSGVRVGSGRHEMRVVRPVGNEDVKVLKAYPAAQFKQIRNEVVNVARVEHPNVLRPELVFMGADNAMVWVQYPYMPHGSLDVWLNRECIPLRLRGQQLLSNDGHEVLCGVFRELLDGVVHLHANGVVHNDLKPANVLMGDDLVPRICDFELSNSVDVSGTRGLGSMTVRGLTANYAAPEVLANRRSTEKSDMYSVGRLMYDTLLHEWLASQPLSYAMRPGEWTFPDDVHPAFRDLVSRLLSDDPSRRPSAVEARAHPFFTQGLYPAAAPLSIQLDVAGALPEQQHWQTDGSDASQRRVPLDLQSHEAIEVASLFYSRGCLRRRIVSIERVENIDLLRRFAFHKHQLAAKYGAPVEEQLLFHGTKPHVVPLIAEQGFDMRLNGANATHYGKGTYFARQASYSAQGTYSPADAQGIKYMFVARVLVGETVVGAPDVPRAERQDGTVVDTAVDNTANPSIFVTFDNGQTIPVYLIAFR